MPRAMTLKKQKQQSPQVTLDRVREKLLSALAERLQEVEALGILGSLA